MAVIRLLFMFQYTMLDCDTIIIIVIEGVRAKKP